MPSARSRQGRSVGAARTFFAGGRAVFSKTAEAIVEPDMDIITVKRRSTPRPRAQAMEASEERCKEWLVSLPNPTQALDDPPSRYSVLQDPQGNEPVDTSERGPKTEPAQGFSQEMIERRGQDVTDSKNLRVRFNPVLSSLLSTPQTRLEVGSTKYKEASTQTCMPIDPGLALPADKTGMSHVRVAAGANAVQGTENEGENSSFTPIPAINERPAVTLRHMSDSDTGLKNATRLQRELPCERSVRPTNGSKLVSGPCDAISGDASRVSTTEPKVIEGPLLVPTHKAIGRTRPLNATPKIPLKADAPAVSITRTEPTKPEADKDQVSSKTTVNVSKGIRAHELAALDISEPGPRDLNESRTETLQVYNQKKPKGSSEEPRIQGEPLLSPISIKLEFVVGGVPTAISVPSISLPRRQDENP